MNKTFSSIALICAATGLVACGGSGGSSESGNDPADSKSSGKVTLGITDAPVDNAEHVFVQFTGVQFVPAADADDDAAVAKMGNAPDNPGGDAAGSGSDNAGDASDQGGQRPDAAGADLLTITFDSPKTIDLLTLQGAARDFLLDAEELPEGEYGQIRLLVHAEHDNVLDSYIQIDGQQHELRIPSGSQTGLKLVHEFSIAPDATVDFTIDFDLRQSVVFAPGQGYMLKPVLRLVETDRAGTISGRVDPVVFAGQSCGDDPKAAYGVYVFAGSAATVDDLGSENGPLITTGVSLDETSQFVYEIGFLEAGEYRLAATCQADADDPEVDDDIAFAGIAAVTVTPGATTTHDFE